MDCGWALRELESHGLGSVGARIPAEVSLGQRRRIALIRALLSEPEVLLIDEPGSGLDVLAAFEFRRALASLVCRDMKLVLVTHDVRDLREIAGTVVVFQAGAVTHVGASADFIANPPDAFSAAFVRF